MDGSSEKVKNIKIFISVLTYLCCSKNTFLTLKKLNFTCVIIYDNNYTLIIDIYFYETFSTLTQTFSACTQTL